MIVTSSRMNIRIECGEIASPFGMPRLLTEAIGGVLYAVDASVLKIASGPIASGPTARRAPMLLQVGRVAATVGAAGRG